MTNLEMDIKPQTTGQCSAVTYIYTVLLVDIHIDHSNSFRSYGRCCIYVIYVIHATQDCTSSIPAEMEKAKKIA